MSNTQEPTTIQGKAQKLTGLLEDIGDAIYDNHLITSSMASQPPYKLSDMPTLIDEICEINYEDGKDDGVRIGKEAEWNSINDYLSGHFNIRYDREPFDYESLASDTYSRAYTNGEAAGHSIGYHEGEKEGRINEQADCVIAYNTKNWGNDNYLSPLTLDKFTSY